LKSGATALMPHASVNKKKLKISFVMHHLNENRGSLMNGHPTTTQSQYAPPTA
jgi:hypothetical protein